MGTGFARRFGVLATTLALLVIALATPAGVAAFIDGGCTGEARASGGSSIDVTTETEWHLSSTDTISGSGTAPSPMTSATLSAYAFGIAIPIRSETGNGDTNGNVDGISMSTFESLGKVFVIAGSASGEGGSCNGQLLIVLDDVDALFTVLGGGGLALAILGLAAVLMASRSDGCLPKALAMVFGVLGGMGLALSLEQFQIISPTSYIGLAIIVVGALLGLFLAGRFAYGGPVEPPEAPAPSAAAATTPAPAPAAPPPPPAPAAPPTPPSDDTQAFVEGVAAPAVQAPPAAASPAPAAAPPTEAPAAPPEPRGPGYVIDSAVSTAAEILGEEAPPPSSPPPPAAPAAEPPPADGPQGDGESHSIPYDPENPPRGGGGPM